MQQIYFVQSYVHNTHIYLMEMMSYIIMTLFWTCLLQI